MFFFVIFVVNIFLSFENFLILQFIHYQHYSFVVNKRTVINVQFIDYKLVIY